MAKPAQTPPAIAVAPAPKSPAAVRAQKFRERQKLQDPDFNKKEAERKETKREEAERRGLLGEALESGQFPVNLVALRKKTGQGLFLEDAPQGLGRVVTGGYDSTKIGTVLSEQRRAKGGKSVFTPPAKRTAPVGHGPDSVKEQAPSTYSYFPPKDVRVMHRFIQNCMDEKPMLVCLICGEQVAPEFSFKAGFNHLHDKHPDRFELMMERVKRANETVKRCTNDHAGLIERHGKGARKLYCGKCRKLLYKPPRPGRSDKPVEALKAA
jgi:ribosomal protein S27AE